MTPMQLMSQTQALCTAVLNYIVLD